MNSCIREAIQSDAEARAHARWIIAADPMEIFHFSRENRYCIAAASSSAARFATGDMRSDPFEEMALMKSKRISIMMELYVYVLKNFRFN